MSIQHLRVDGARVGSVGGEPAAVPQVRVLDHVVEDLQDIAAVVLHHEFDAGRGKVRKCLSEHSSESGIAGLAGFPRETKPLSWTT